MVFATGVIVLAVLPGLTARHVLIFALATVFHVAAGVRVLAAVLRSCAERRRGNRQRCDTGETH